MTYLQIVQDLMKRLRKFTPTVTSFTSVQDTQLDLYRVLINDAKRDIESAHAWRALDKAIPLTVSATLAEYSIVGLTTTDRFAILDVHDTVQKSVLKNDASLTFNRRKLQPQNGPPTYFIVKPPLADTTVPRIEFYPTPADTRLLTLYVNAPQEDLTLETDVPLVPAHLVCLGAYARAYMERGEAVSTAPLGGSPLKEYQDALDVAITLDKELQNHGESDDWWVRSA